MSAGAVVAVLVGEDSVMCADCADHAARDWSPAPDVRPVKRWEVRGLLADGWRPRPERCRECGEPLAWIEGAA